jgi:serine/threonine-protein kinase
VRTCSTCRRAFRRDERFCPIDGIALSEGREGVDPLIGATLAGRYTLSREVGRGGMGVVYQAEHIGLGKRVAVKLLLDTYSEDREVLARFHQEARTSTRIGHENIIDISDLGEHSGRSFIVMEFLEGRDLAAVLHEEILLAPERALPILRQICLGLDAAHQKGVIHRDMKPENVFLTARGGVRDFVKVMDFGISKIKAAHEQDVRLTQTGALIGTPLYMAPEQALGRTDVDHRVDVYSVGIMMFEMLCGKPPFEAPTYVGLLAQHLNDTPPRPRKLRPELPPHLEPIMMRALEKDPARRWPSLSELAVALGGEAAASRSVPRTKIAGSGALTPPVVSAAAPAKRSVWPWILVTLLVLGAAGGALWGWRQRTASPLAAPAPTPAPPAKAEAPAPAPVPAAVTPITSGTLEVTSDPTGATLTLDGVPQGETPLYFDRISAGPHHLRLELDGHETLDATKIVRAGKDESFAGSLARLKKSKRKANATDEPPPVPTPAVETRAGPEASSPPPSSPPKTASEPAAPGPKPDDKKPNPYSR